jgi:hypothetical protein
MCLHRLTFSAVQEDTISSVIIVSSGYNYVAGDLVVSDVSGSGSGCLAQFNVNVSGSIERLQSFLLMKCLRSDNLLSELTSSCSVYIANHGHGDIGKTCFVCAFTT